MPKQTQHALGVTHAHNPIGTLARKIDGQTYSRLRDPDPPLSKLGRDQVNAIGDFLTGTEGNRMFSTIDELLVSPCCRALQTASILSERLEVQATVSTTLHEVGGLWPNETTGEDPRSVSGGTPTEMQRWCPDCAIPPSVTQDGWYDLSAGREKDTDARVRAGDFILGAFDSIAEKDPTKLHVVAVVTHGAFLSMLLGILMAPGADMGGLPQFKHARSLHHIVLHSYHSWLPTPTAFPLSSCSRLSTPTAFDPPVHATQRRHFDLRYQLRRYGDVSGHQRNPPSP